MKHDFTKCTRDYWIKTSRLNCSGCKVWAKQMEIIRTMSDTKQVGLQGTNEGISEKYIE